jgi:hypothetical protein
MIISQTLGDVEDGSGECEYLTLAFSPLSVPLRSRWRNNGLSADFLGDYVITFLPREGEVDAGESGRNVIKHAVTYIANELLENVMKYHARNLDIPIGIHLKLTGEHITVSASNGVAGDQAERYNTFIASLLAGDPCDMFMKQQEEGAKASEPTASCLGLLTMINDYGAKLGWRFDVHPGVEQTVTITTSAILPLKTMPGASA